MDLTILKRGDLQEAIRSVARAHKLRLIVLYGSFTRGTTSVRSDVDVGVLGENVLSAEAEAAIGEELVHVLDDARIEVRSLNQVSPLFLHSVMNDAVVLFEERSGIAAELKLYAWKLAAETKPLRDARYRKTRNRVLLHV
jgi:predicted nucleotidyltransferase